MYNINIIYNIVYNNSIMNMIIFDNFNYQHTPAGSKHILRDSKKTPEMTELSSMVKFGDCLDLMKHY